VLLTGSCWRWSSNKEAKFDREQGAFDHEEADTTGDYVLHGG
jgi:hypothetical protein